MIEYLAMRLADLVENSLRAGAGHIALARCADRRRIEVSDEGADRRPVLLHATSPGVEFCGVLSDDRGDVAAFYARDP